MSSKIIDKIQRLLNLAEGKGTTPAEAATAAAQAQRLMLKYNVTRLEVEAENGVDEEEITAHEFEEPSWRMRGWRQVLAWGVARTNSCRALSYKGKYYSKRHQRHAKITFIGTPTNIAVVNYMYMYLSREIDRLAKEAKRPEHIQADRFRNAFRIGAANEIVRRLQQEQVVQRREVKSTALVRVDQHDAAVASYLEANFRTRSASVRSTSLEGERAGRKAAQNIALNKAMNGRNRGLLK